MAIGAMAYSVLGGALADLSWRAPFGVHVLALIFFLPAFFFLPEPPALTQPADRTPASTEKKSVPWGAIGGLYGIAFLGLAVFNLARVELPYYLRTLGVQSGAWIGGLLLAGGGMGLLVPTLNDGVGEAAPRVLRGRLMGGLSTLRNLGRFAAPVLAYPGLVGAGAAAPFLGGAVLAGSLTLGMLLWTTAQSASDGAPNQTAVEESRGDAKWETART